MVPNSNNDLYQLGKVNAIFRLQPIFDYCPQIFKGAKFDEFPGHSRTFIWFSWDTFFTFLWQHDMGPGLAKKYLHHLKMLSACKALSEKDRLIKFFFSSSGMGSLCAISGMMNADKCIDVIQRKIVREMQTAFPDAGPLREHSGPGSNINSGPPLTGIW